MFEHNECNMKQNVLMKQEARVKMQRKRWIKIENLLFLFSTVKCTKIVA